jgi:hypothetical protein
MRRFRHGIRSFVSTVFFAGPLTRCARASSIEARALFPIICRWWPTFKSADGCECRLSLLQGLIWQRPSTHADEITRTVLFCKMPGNPSTIVRFIVVASTVIIGSSIARRSKHRDRCSFCSLSDRRCKRVGLEASSAITRHACHTGMLTRRPSLLALSRVPALRAGVSGGVGWQRE